MNNIALLLFLLAPLATFAQGSEELTLTPAGLTFMLGSWIGIIIWNLVCFKIILKK